MKSECTKRSKEKYIKVEENKRKAVFRNSGRHLFEVTKIDNCVVTEGLRADYLVSKDAIEGGVSVIVELKGSDVEHACKQLLATIENNDVKSLLKKKVGFLVVCSKYPRFDTFVAKAKSKIVKEYKAGFHVVTDRCEFDIERVAEIDGPY